MENRKAVIPDRGGAAQDLDELSAIDRSRRLDDRKKMRIRKGLRRARKYRQSNTPEGHLKMGAKPFLSFRQVPHDKEQKRQRRLADASIPLQTRRR